MASLSAKRKSPEDASHHDEARTPTNSPPRKKLRITRNQKQALMDNLQLEITERARKLRAQYALQANDLRARIERRVNRIPMALRKAKMGELLEKHTASLRAQQENTSPRKLLSPAKAPRNFATISVSPNVQKASAASPSARRVKKQSHGEIYSDKENAPAAGEPLDVLKNPKRRGAAAGTSRVVSQEMRGADYRILSPKTSNSRTYPQSPLRASPEKPTNSSYLSRPMSPLKPSSPLKSTTGIIRTVKGASSAIKDNRPPSQAAKRPVSRAATGSKTLRSPLPRPATRQLERRGSVSSSASSGTTVAKPTRTGTGARKATTASTSSATTKKSTVARQTASAAAKRNTTSATTKRAPTPAGGDAPTTTTAGRRVLRKRA
ncbi:hypothetical protein BO70DRAFT_359414 [Aspergillus heteromorphus CBS 117.55]|uniref:Borealin N-terminal domain-containing protein n=1 Tax=Aspergillus heteromorphus CBS 117.55 TaxID=1448321 RepID=A0A317WSP0_9EURO|nr:uncharacterized protein BO70DRAFT_359414 [Aspergillus heteromorphus CBS 117.55]PWY89095.1 hypothetical protein BO70DRAFT_359414 [Aspergillus heteromorphus CBS 117.55]